MKALSLRAGRLLPLAALLLSGCSDPGDNVVALLVGGVVGIMLIGMWGCGLYTACIAASGVSIHHNRTQPTARSKRWGWIFGVLNVINGGAMGALLVAAQGRGETELDVQLYWAAYSVAALAAGIAGIVFAVRAKPA